MIEKIVSAAIIRDGTQHNGFREHWRIRAALGDPEPTHPKAGDQEGFLTSEGRFVSRREANEIAVAAGQCHNIMTGRPFLSADIDHWGTP